jgi:hypothetical protein
MGFSGKAGGAGAAQGAQAGMMFGPWGAVIGAAVGFVAGGLEGGKAEKAAAKALKEMRKQQMEHNERIRIETSRQAAEISMQRAMKLSATATAVSYTKREAGLLDSDITVQNSVADAIGASAQIMSTAVIMEKEAAIGNTFREQDATMIGFDATLQSMLNGTRSMLDLRAPPTKEQGDNGVQGLFAVGSSLFSQGAFNKGGAFNPTSAPSTSGARKGLNRGTYSGEFLR